MSIDFAIGEQRSQDYWNKRSASLQGKAKQDYRDPSLSPAQQAPKQHPFDGTYDQDDRYPDMVELNNPPSKQAANRETAYEVLPEEKVLATTIDPDPSAVSEPVVFGELWGSAADG